MMTENWSGNQADCIIQLGSGSSSVSPHQVQSRALVGVWRSSGSSRNFAIRDWSFSMAGIGVEENYFSGCNL